MHTSPHHYQRPPMDIPNPNNERGSDDGANKEPNTKIWIPIRQPALASSNDHTPQSMQHAPVNDVKPKRDVSHVHCQSAGEWSLQDLHILEGQKQQKRSHRNPEVLFHCLITIIRRRREVANMSEAMRRARTNSRPAPNERLVTKAITQNAFLTTPQAFPRLELLYSECIA